MRLFDDISNFIFMEDTLEPADVIFIPGGSYAELPEEAARLWIDGYGTYVIPSGKYGMKGGTFSGPKSKKEQYNKQYASECDFYSDVLTTMGVDEKYIIREEESTFTAQNAKFTRTRLDELHIEPKTAILCCKGFHARRCYMYYQFYFPNTKIMIAPVNDFAIFNINKENWYLSEYGQKRVLGELARLGTQFENAFHSILDAK